MSLETASSLPLSARDKKNLIDVIEEFASVDTSMKFIECTTGRLQLLLPHEMNICGIGKPTDEVNGQIEIYKLVAHNFPKKYLDEIFLPEGAYNCPEIKHWRNKREPLVFEAERDGHKLDPQRLAVFNRFAFKNNLAHGVIDIQGHLFSYFSFLRLPLLLGDRERLLIKLLVPDMHAALRRITSNTKQQASISPHDLTERQQHILYLLHQGKTNAEISTALNLSIANVKYHIAKIFLKLQATNRVQAVSKAVALGIICTSDYLLKMHILEGAC